MIELTYFVTIESEKQVYQVIQFRPGEAWQIVDDGEVIGKIDCLDGMWNLRCGGVISEGMASGIAKLIESQHFNSLPMDIKTHWGHFVQEVIVRSDEEYLVICLAGIDFERFERLFRECVSGLIRDPWEIRFCVYDAEMANDFEVRARGLRKAFMPCHSA